MFPAGTRIRNLERSTPQRRARTSMIALLVKHTCVDRRDVAQCAAYDASVCKLGKNRTLFGCHVKLDTDPKIYIIPMCPTHNNSLRGGQLDIRATRPFDALVLDTQAEDEPVIRERARTHLVAFAADVKQLTDEFDELLREIHDKMDRLEL